MAFPTTAVLDDFTRSDTGPPPSASWSTGPRYANGHKVVSNTARGNGTGAQHSSYWNPSLFGPDCEVYLTVAAMPGTDNQIDLYLRCTQPGETTVDGYRMRMFQRAGTDEWTFEELVNGGTIGIGSLMTTDVAAGDLIGFECVGTTLKAWHKPSAGSWTLVGSATDTAIQTAGYLGFGNWQSTTSAPTIDSVGGGNTVVVSEPEPEPEPVSAAAIAAAEALGIVGQLRDAIGKAEAEVTLRQTNLALALTGSDAAAIATARARAAYASGALTSLRVAYERAAGLET